MVSYRVLSSADLQAARGLNRLFAVAFEEPETYLDKAPDDAYMRDLLAKEDFIALIAEREGVIVGGLTAYVMHKMEQDRREIYIYDLAVDENHRRQGIATGMLRYMQKLAKERGVYLLTIEAEEGDEPPIAVYSALGKQEVALHFEIPPEP